MILHVAGLATFIPPFVKLVNEEFNGKKHVFWLNGSIKEFRVEENTHVYVAGNSFLSKVRAYIKLVCQLHCAKKIILHGLFSTRVVAILAVCPWLLSKCYWLIWGNDLYQYRNAKASIPSRFKELLRRFVIRRIGYLVTYIKGDVELARKWYGARGTYQECLMYLSNVFDPSYTPPAEEKKESTIYILVGNSADPSNNHIEILDRLLPYKEHDINIFVPLSYGSRDHASYVVRKGNQFFGNKFNPLTSFMNFGNYLKFLSSIDIAFFNHRRQQAMGNTITLLGMGKTVYMRSDVAQWALFRDLGIKVFDMKWLELSMLSADDVENNKRLVCEFFSRERIIFQYAEIFK